MMGTVLRAPGGAGTLVGTQNPLPLAVPVPAAAVLKERRGWDVCGDGSRDHGVAHGPGVRPRLPRSCAINTTALLPLTCHQCDQRDL